MKLLAVLFGTLATLAFADEPIPVQTARLDTLLQPTRGDAPAQVISLNDGWLEAEISAPIATINRRVGDAVSAGDTVVQLNCRRFERERDLAAAQMKILAARQNLALAQLKRAQNLRESRNISEEVFNQRESEMAAVEAEIAAQQVALAIATDNVERCEIKAPFSGAVIARRAQVGEFAAPGKQLIHILDTTSVELTAQLTERDLATLLSAREASYQYNGKFFKVAVRAVVPRVASGSRTQEVRLSFNDTAPPPGASGRLNWRLPGGLLPAEYLVRRDKELGVFVAKDERAVFVTLRDAREGRPTQVSLPPSTLVITAGRYAVTNDAPIAPSDEKLIRAAHAATPAP